MNVFRIWWRRWYSNIAARVEWRESWLGVDRTSIIGVVRVHAGDDYAERATLIQPVVIFCGVV